MPLMEPTHYLPDEEINFRNYPELYTVWDDLQKINAYATRVHKALADYTSGQYDKIDLNTEELNSYITLCRNVCSVLGQAPKVCFDILLDLRELQYHMQILLYNRRRFGSKFIGTPSTSGEGDL